VRGFVLCCSAGCTVERLSIQDVGLSTRGCVVVQGSLISQAPWPDESLDLTSNELEAFPRTVLAKSMTSPPVEVIFRWHNVGGGAGMRWTCSIPGRPQRVHMSLCVQKTLFVSHRPCFRITRLRSLRAQLRRTADITAAFERSTRLTSPVSSACPQADLAQRDQREIDPMQPRSCAPVVVSRMLDVTAIPLMACDHQICEAADVSLGTCAGGPTQIP
jgi:hypothetical protein